MESLSSAVIRIVETLHKQQHLQEQQQRFIYQDFIHFSDGTVAVNICPPSTEETLPDDATHVTATEIELKPPENCLPNALQVCTKPKPTTSKSRSHLHHIL